MKFVYKENRNYSEDQRGNVISKWSYWEVFLLQGSKVTDRVKRFDTEQEAIDFCGSDEE